MDHSDAESAVARLRDWSANTAIVLGSGLNSLVGSPPSADVVSYSAFPGLPRSTVPGHVGQFVLAEVNRIRVVFAQGRLHLYEGRSPEQVTSIVRVLGESGIRRLVLTNAAGSLNPVYRPGEWMMITDQINLTGVSPLAGTPEFLDMTDAYSVRLRNVFAATASNLGLPLHQGLYAGLLGPQYETPAEVRMLRGFGADSVGMSTVLEAIQARALGIEIAGFSCLTNFAAGISPAKLSHDEVLQTGRAAAEAFERLLTAAIPQI